MTTVVAIVDGDHVVMGADSQGTSGRTHYCDMEKIIRAGEWLIGFSGDLRVVSIMREHIEELSSSRCIERMVSSLKSMVQEDGWKPEKDTGAPCYGIEFLIARHGDLYEIDGAFAIAEQHGATIGSGSLVGLGALRAIHKIAPDLKAKPTVNRVLEVAGEVDIYTGKPFQIESTQPQS